MNEELYQKVAQEIDALSTEFLHAPNLTPNERELHRQQFRKEWEQVCAANGVTVEEFDIAMEERLDKIWRNEARMNNIIKLVGPHIAEFRFLHYSNNGEVEIHLSENVGTFILKRDGTWSFQEKT